MDPVRAVIAVLMGLNVALIMAVAVGYQGPRRDYVRLMALWGMLLSSAVSLGNYALRGTPYTIRTWLSLAAGILGLWLYGRMAMAERRRSKEQHHHG